MESIFLVCHVLGLFEKKLKKDNVNYLMWEDKGSLYNAKHDI